ncbi:MAG TPA: hypothetical protein VKV17_16165 [Bryobacteraceae bacterium]|nr:hypothetical protein [Bryobacteraceae bacterium]
MNLFSGAISRRRLFALGGAAASGCVAAKAVRAQTASGQSAYRSAPGAPAGFDTIFGQWATWSRWRAD